jgi:hypothetical protein
LFEFVASPEEWQTFLSFGQVTGIDRWIDSYADGTGKLDDYERLQSAFLTRVQDRLSSGEWTCEAFDPKLGPELRLIPEQLWRSLQFVPYEDAVSGAGFKFVNLLFSSRAKSARAPSSTPGTIRRRLTEWLRKIAEDQRDPVRRADLLNEAKSALGENHISQNMLDECLRANELGDALLVRGRPPT